MNRSLFAIAALGILASSTVALAQAPTNVGAFQKWNVFSSSEPTGKMCFIASQPMDSKYSQPITSRDPVFFMITSIPAKNIRNEVSTIVGYAFGPNATVQLDIDGTKYTMFTANTDTAWAMPDQEAALITALKNGAKLTIVGTSKRGTVTTDTYSLIGITAALGKMATECP
jgi:invasion protein IalB